MERGNFKSRLIKCIPIFMILVFGFVMRCELFHIKLGDELAAHYLSSSCMVSANEFERFKNDIKENSEKYDSPIAFCMYKNNTKIEHILNIYLTNENAANLIKEEYGITDGLYKSFMNGSTQIDVKTIDELTYEEVLANPWLVFVTDETSAKSIYAELSRNYEISYPRMMQGEETDMIIIISVLVIIVMVTINAVSVFRKRKENIIREVYGEDVVGLTAKAIFADLITFEALYLAAKLTVSLFSSDEYKPGLSFALFQIGCISAALLNLLYLKADKRAAFSNVTHSACIYKLLYALKTAAFFFATFTLATNLSNLAGQTLSKGSKVLYSSYKDATFVYLYDKNLMNDEEYSNEGIKDSWSELVKTRYDEIKPVVDIMLVSGNPSVLVMNDYAKELLPDDLQAESEGKTDIVVFCKSGKEMAEYDIEGLIGLYFENASNISYEMKTYDNNMNVPYISTGTLSAIDNAFNPTVFYIKDFDNIRADMLKDNQDIFFNVSEQEMKQLLEDSQIIDTNDVSTTNFGDYYEYQMSFIARLISFLSSLCVLVIILEMLITSVLIRMEYKIFGMDYAVKKILGYSFLEKNKTQLIKLILPNLIAICFVTFIGAFTNLYRPVLGIELGCCLLVGEIVVVLIKALSMETTAIRKILKGGCL